MSSQLKQIFVVAVLAVVAILSRGSDDERPPPSDVVGMDGCLKTAPEANLGPIGTIECEPAGRPANCPAGVDGVPLIQLSIDGFRAEYLTRGLTPSIEALRECGVRVPRMRPVFPSKTFTNHYSIATGLYAESHGILSNKFMGTEFLEIFNYGGRNNSDYRWWGGEPIWNTAIKAGLRVHTMMWGGTDVNIQGIRPAVCYDNLQAIHMDQRLATLLTWFDTEPNKWPNFANIYWDILDGSGHQTGPYSKRTNNTLGEVDDLVSHLFQGLRERMGNCFNFIITSDHGMAEIRVPEHVVDLGEYLDMSRYNQIGDAHARITGQYKAYSDTNVTVLKNPVPVKVTLDKIRCRDYDSVREFRFRPMRKEDLPKRYHFVNNIRIEEIVFDNAVNFYLTDNMENFLHGYRPGVYGQHGYDNAYPEVQAIFVGYGPYFKNTESEVFENIELYNMLSEDLLGIKGAPNNGTRGRLNHLLVNPQPIPPLNNPGYTAPDDSCSGNGGGSGGDCSCSDWDLVSSDTVEDADARLDLSAKTVKKLVKRLLPFGLPTGKFPTCLLAQEDYLMGYSDEYKMPLWTAFSVKPAKTPLLVTRQLRSDDEYKGCSRIDGRLSAPTACSDYSSSSAGVSGNFLFPPGLSSSKESQADAYISSNMVPMYTNFRSGTWRDALWLLEEYADKYGEIKVLAGPMFDYNGDGFADSLDKINWFVGSDGQVPVPTHYYLIFTRCDAGDDCDKSTEVMSLIVPHREEVVTQCWGSLTTSNRLSTLGKNYLRFNTARVKDVELLTSLSLFNDMTPFNRLNFITFLSEQLWPEISWMDLSEQGECPNRAASACPAGYAGQPPLIVVSLSGFRADYVDRGVTPTIKKLYDCGVSAPYIQSMYPSKTVANQYSIITGLYPESHGIVDDEMYDPNFGEYFSIKGDSFYDAYWWSGEPLWNTAVKNDKVAVSYFWAGSKVNIGGSKPTKTSPPYSAAHPYSLRIDTILQWLNSSTNGARPSLATVHLDGVDEIGRFDGPDSQQVYEALKYTDGAIKQLMDGLYRLHLHECANVILVSEQGMSMTPCNNKVQLGDYLSSDDLSKVYVREGPAGGISNTYTKSGGSFQSVDAADQVSVSELTEALNCKANLVAFDKQDLPRRLHYSSSPRIPDVQLLMDETYEARSTESSCGLYGHGTYGLGQHGWDPRYDSMKGLFLAYGPDFAQSKTVEPFENIELYNLMARLIDVKPAPNNGTEGSLFDLLASPPTLPPRPQGSDYSVGQYSEGASDVNCNCEQVGNKKIKKYNARLDFSADEQSSLEADNVPYGLPIYDAELLHQGDDKAYLLHQTNFVSAYCEELKQPKWCAAKITANEVLASSQISTCTRGDVRLTAPQPACSDLGSKNIAMSYFFPPEWSDDVDTSTEAQLLTNVIPMYTSFKNGVWADALDYMKGLPAKFPDDQIYAIGGPVFDYNGDGRFDTDLTAAKAAGGGDIPVPSHIFVILLKCSSGSCDKQQYDTLAFVLPQIYPASECISAEDVMSLNVARIRDVELLTGLEFFRNQESVQAAARMRVAIKDTMW